jgi:hypothetical protein
VWRKNMLARSRSRLVPLAAAAMLLAMSTGAVAAAGRPAPVIGFHACWNGSNVVMSLTWSRVAVDGYSFGWSNDEGGLGVPGELSRPSASGTVSSVSADFELTVDTSATWAGGSLTFRGNLVGEGSTPKPDAGWDTLVAC